MAEIDQQQHRGEVEEQAKDPGERLGAAMLVEEEILQGARRSEMRVASRRARIPSTAGSIRKISRHARAARRCPPAGGGGGEGGELIQHCGDLGRLGIIRGAADEAEHAVGKPADRHRHGLRRPGSGRAEPVAQMGEVAQGVLQQRVGRFEVFDQRLLLVQPAAMLSMSEPRRTAWPRPRPRSSTATSRSLATAATRGS